MLSSMNFQHPVAITYVNAAESAQKLMWDRVNARVASDRELIIVKDQFGGLKGLEEIDHEEMFVLPDRSVAFSYATRVNQVSEPMADETLALAVLKGLGDMGVPDISFKYPNDIFWNGKKIGGLLGEYKDFDDQRWYVGGIVLNLSLRQDDLPEELRTIAASISDTGADEKSGDEYVKAIVEHFDAFVDLQSSESGCQRVMSDLRGYAGYIPLRYHAVTQILVLKDARAAVEFYRRVFGAINHYDEVDAQGRCRVCQLQIGDSMLLIHDEEIDDSGVGKNANFLYLYVHNLERTLVRATADGAMLQVGAARRSWGDATARIRDPFGVTWEVAQVQTRQPSPSIST